MPDLIDRIKMEIGSRLDDLRPHVEEYRRLVAAQQALGGSGADGVRAAAPRQARAKPRRKRSPATAPTKSSPAQTQP